MLKAINDTIRAGKVVLRTRLAVKGNVAIIVPVIWTVLAAVVPSQAFGQPSDGLVAHWTFDEGTGTAVHDSSPNHNDGTLINGANAWTVGHSGGGLHFDGSSRTEVRIPASTSLAQFTAASFAAWVNNAEPDRDGPIIAKEGPGSQNRSYWFGCIGSQFGMLLSPDGNSWPTIEASRRMGGVPANRWTHLAATWDGATMRMYENGLLIGTYGYTQVVANTDTYTSIGVNSALNTTQFHGVLDDVYVYNRALSADEVASLMGTSVCNDAFSDTFNPPSPLWNNYLGNWTASGNGYYAQNASNNPLTYSGLPFDASDFEINLQINSFSDGGVWLRSDGTNRNGILLVTGGNGYGQGLRSGGAGQQLYFHRVVNGSVSGAMANTANIFTPGTNHSLRIVVSGSGYAVFVDGSITPATVLVDSTFSHGQVGLYCDQPNIPGGGSGPPQSIASITITGIGPVLDPVQPVSACASATVQFAVNAHGSGPFSYEWRKNGAPIDSSPTGNPSAATATLVLTNVGPLDVATYDCIVSNDCGSVTSNPAALDLGNCTPPCPADFNGDGVLNSDDLSDYITGYFNDPADPATDFNGDGVINADDLGDFITAYFNGC